VNDGSSCDSFIVQRDRINPTAVRPWLEMPMKSEVSDVRRRRYRLGFAWPHMTFVLVDDCRLVIMASVWPP
jgi:hypothetical protein